MSSCAFRRSDATTDSSIVATLPLPGKWDLGPLPKLAQDRLALAELVVKVVELGETGLGSILIGGLAGPIISTCRE